MDPTAALVAALFASFFLLFTNINLRDNVGWLEGWQDPPVAFTALAAGAAFIARVM